MTLHARRRYVAARNGSFGLRMGKYRMTGMTIDARCRYRETFFEQAFAVNTLAVVLYNVVLGNIVRTGDRCAFPVASSAGVGNAHLVCG